jgi:hypothetical protein
MIGKLRGAFRQIDFVEQIGSVNAEAGDQSDFGALA